MQRTSDATRRRLLAVTGASLAAMAGCTSDSGDPPSDGPETNESDPTGENGSDDETETDTSVDYPSDYDAVVQDGVEVPLVPIDDAYEWYQAEEARFVDARGRGQYQSQHIAGAVLSPAVGELDGEDPVDDWPTDADIVTYCGCPHHLSSIRAASLIQEGYESVYALDEGFWAWVDRGYPLEGKTIDDEDDDEPALRVVRGVTDPTLDLAGEMALAAHEPSQQFEAAPIGTDGGYELHLRFVDVVPDSTIAVETPDYTVEATLAELEDGLITSDGAVRT